jgi:RNA polymerase sigma-70 factor (ECF subfamily)
MVSARSGSIDDVALARNLVEGSEAALETLYDRHAAAIFATAYRLTSDRGIAEEVVQDTFLALWNRADSFDPAMGSFTAWLHAIARNRCIDRLRAASRRPSLIALDSASGSDADPAETIDRLLSQGSGGAVVAGSARLPGPEEAVAAAALHDTIRLALAVMPEPERTVILLAYQESLSQREIAERLGWPLGTVKTRTRRALLRLREALGSEFGPNVGDDALPVPAGEDG